MTFCRKSLFVLFSLALAAPLALAEDSVQERIFQDNLKRAEAGDANAQFIVAHRYEIGVGTEKSMDKAFQWYGKAAQQGHPLAQHKIDQRKEESDAENRARVEAEQAKKKAEQQKEAQVKAEADARKRAEQQKEAQVKAEADARKRAEQAEAARKRKAAEAAEVRPVVVAAAAPVRPAEPVASDPAINAMDVVLGGLWQQNQQSADILPSPNASCLRTSGTEITCFTGESRQNVGNMRLAYTVKTVMTRFNKDGSFQVHYMYNVTDMDEGGAAASTDARALSEIKPKTGWQEPGYSASCRASNERSIQCTTDRKAVVQFSRM